MKLYKWQAECLDHWIHNHCHGIVNVVTGAGKTRLAIACIQYLSEGSPADRRCPRLHVRVVVPTIAIASQWQKTLREFFPNGIFGDARISTIGGGRNDCSDASFVIYVLNSARLCLSSHIQNDMRQGHSVFLIADECHRCASKENRHIFDFLLSQQYDRKLYFSLGLSATPRCSGYEMILVPSLGKEIYRYDFARAVSDGTVSSFCIIQTALPFAQKEATEYSRLSDQLSYLHVRLMDGYGFLHALSGNDFFQALRNLAEDEGEGSVPYQYLMTALKRAELVRGVKSRSSALKLLLTHLPVEASVIIFCERIQQADEVARTLEQCFPGRVGKYHSELPAQLRNNTLELFSCGEYRFLVTCKALDEGINVPDASIGIVLSGTSVMRQRIQRLGRILRLAPGKRCAVLYYLYVRDSSEESAFLYDENGNIPVYHMQYYYSPDPEDAGFISFPEYESRICEIMDSLNEKGILQPVPGAEQELLRCLMDGMLAHDWLASPEENLQHARSCRTKKERNYHIAMALMAAKLRSKML